MKPLAELQISAPRARFFTSENPFDTLPDAIILTLSFRPEPISKFRTVTNPSSNGSPNLSENSCGAAPVPLIEILESYFFKNSMEMLLKDLPLCSVNSYKVNSCICIYHCFTQCSNFRRISNTHFDTNW